jgi:hypothetical protein
VQSFLSNFAASVDTVFNSALSLEELPATLLAATNVALLLTAPGNSLVKMCKKPDLQLTRAVWRAVMSPLHSKNSSCW